MPKIGKISACLAGLLIEILFVLLLAAGRSIFFPLYLLLHLAACCLFAYGTASFFRQARGWWKISLFCCVFLAIYGFAGVVFILILSRVRKGKGEVFHLDVDEEDEEEQENPAAHPDSAGGAEILEVESFADILKGEDKEMRLGAIDALQQLKDRNAISMLADSLDSTFQEVRYYAVEALNRIAQEYMDKITVLQQMVEIKPDDDVIRLTLAGLYFEYAFKGIEEEAIREYYYGLAAKQYRLLLTNRSGDLKLLGNLLETEYMLASYPGCMDICRRVLALDRSNVQAVRRLADCFIKTGDYPGLKQLAAEITRREDLPVELRQPAEMWIRDG